jgi:hypothetical protein
MLQAMPSAACCRTHRLYYTPVLRQELNSCHHGVVNMHDGLGRAILQAGVLQLIGHFWQYNAVSEMITDYSL